MPILFVLSRAVGLLVDGGGFFELVYLIESSFLGLCQIGLMLVFSTESLILAQDERWRRA